MSEQITSFSVGDVVEELDTGNIGTVVRSTIRVDQERVEYYVHGDDIDEDQRFIAEELVLVESATRKTIRNIVNVLQGLDGDEDEDAKDDEDSEEGEEGDDE